jgi:hypothetical protein
MKTTKDIAALLDEPACEHNKKEKFGCAKPKPGSAACGCAFDGAQIALLPIADVAHIVHGPIACAGSSWDNRGTRSSGADLYLIGMTTDSRSLLSMSRHEYFRRVLCDWLGDQVEAGVLPHDDGLLGGLIRAICHANARAWVGL